MKGAILIEAKAGGLNVQTAMEHVGLEDKLFIFQALAHSLNVSPSQLGMFATLMKEKISEVECVDSPAEFLSCKGGEGGNGKCHQCAEPEAEAEAEEPSLGEFLRWLMSGGDDDEG